MRNPFNYVANSGSSVSQHPRNFLWVHANLLTIIAPYGTIGEINEDLERVLNMDTVAQVTAPYHSRGNHEELSDYIIPTFSESNVPPEALELLPDHNFDPSAPVLTISDMANLSELYENDGTVGRRFLLATALGAFSIFSIPLITLGVISEFVAYERIIASLPLGVGVYGIGAILIAIAVYKGSSPEQRNIKVFKRYRDFIDNKIVGTALVPHTHFSKENDIGKLALAAIKAVRSIYESSAWRDESLFSSVPRLNLRTALLDIINPLMEVQVAHEELQGLKKGGVATASSRAVELHRHSLELIAQKIFALQEYGRSIERLEKESGRLEAIGNLSLLEEGLGNLNLRLEALSSFDDISLANELAQKHRESLCTAFLEG